MLVERNIGVGVHLVRETQQFFTSVIDGGDLPDRLQAVEPPAAIALDLPVDGINLPEALDALETRLVRQALERTGGNRNQAAKLLGINRTTLYSRMESLQKNH